MSAKTSTNETPSESSTARNMGTQRRVSEKIINPRMVYDMKLKSQQWSLVPALLLGRAITSYGLNCVYCFSCLFTLQYWLKRTSSWEKEDRLLPLHPLPNPPPRRDTRLPQSRVSSAERWIHSCRTPQAIKHKAREHTLWAWTQQPQRGGWDRVQGLATQGIMGPAMLRDHNYLHRRGSFDRDAGRFTEHAR